MHFEYATDVINFEKNKMLPLTENEVKSHHNMQRNVTFVEKRSHENLLNIKINGKLETIVILQVNTKVEHKVFVTYDLMCLTKFLYFFTTFKL